MHGETSQTAIDLTDELPVEQLKLSLPSENEWSWTNVVLAFANC